MEIGARACAPLGQSLRDRRIGGLVSLAPMTSVMALRAPFPVLKSLGRVVCELAPVTPEVRPVDNKALG